MKKKDLPRLEKELHHYSSTYRFANKEGKEQLSLYICRLKRDIATHSQQVDEEPPEPTPQLPYCPSCGVSANGWDDRACWNCGATIPL